jgi:flagellar capping protein FliD
MGSSTITLARNEPPMNSIINTNVGYLFDDSDGLKKEILNISYAYQNDLNIINQKLKKQYELLKTKYNSGVLYKEILKVYEH